MSPNTSKSPVKLPFAPSTPLTLGVEIEVQLLDRTTLDLKPSSPMILEAYDGPEDRVKAEIFQSMIEFNTGICKDAHEVERDLSSTMDAVSKITNDLGLRIASAGTHPFARYNDRVLYPAVRYQELIDRNQWIARRLMIFGLHVHIGMKSGEHAMQMNNALLHHLPVLLALSASSPYWHGEDTELASSRITFFEALPTGGHPCIVKSWEEFEDLHEKLMRSGAIGSTKDIWWDIRPSPSFGTLEIRICDGLATLAETTALVALIHCLSHYIDEQLERGRRFLPPPDWIMRENKWRASRHGVEANMIVNENGECIALKSLAGGLMEELAPKCRQFSYQNQFNLLAHMLESGPSYRRQRQVAASTGGDLKAVTESLATEFENRTPIWFEEHL